MYGLGVTMPFKLWIWGVTSPTDVVSRAYSTARLSIYFSRRHSRDHSLNILVYRLIIVDSRVAFTSVYASRQWRAQFPDEAVIRDTKISQFHGKAHQM